MEAVRPLYWGGYSFLEENISGMGNSVNYFTRPYEYWSSPTYSDWHLRSWRGFMVERHGKNFENIKFPVGRDVKITQTLEPFVKFVNGHPGYTERYNNKRNFTHSTNGSVWEDWYDWRDQLHAKKFEKIAGALSVLNMDNPNWKGCGIMNYDMHLSHPKCMPPNMSIDTSYSIPYGQMGAIRLDLILKSKGISFLDLETRQETGEAYLNAHSREAPLFAKLARSLGKEFGTWAHVTSLPGIKANGGRSYPLKNIEKQIDIAAKIKSLSLGMLTPDNFIPPNNILPDYKGGNITTGAYRGGNYYPEAKELWIAKRKMYLNHVKT
jgi:hypothetical protein